jgi:soluble lytic murein transglycosylase-like protein
VTHRSDGAKRRRSWPTGSQKSRAFTASAFLAVALLTGSSRSSADIYTYTSRDGTVHFTNLPAGDPRYRLYMKSREGRRGGGAVVAPSDTSPERFSRYDESIREAATLYQIPEELVRAVIKVESDYDPRAVSRAGAQGLMQLMPDTAVRMQVRDVMDPRENVLGGVRYLRVLANMFNGDLQLTLAGYNAGENAVVRFGGIPPYDETEDYVVRVLTYYRRYRDTKDPASASSSQKVD